MNFGDWVVRQAHDTHRDIHVMPVADLREHNCTPLCWCRPLRDDADPEIVLHNAMDRREQYERGNAMAS